MIRSLFLAFLLIAAPAHAASIWSSTAVTPADTNRIPVDVSASGAPSHITPLTLKAYMEAGGTVTASDPVLDLSQTWNNAAVPFTAVKVNVTNTASAVDSLLQDWQTDGVSRAYMRSDGLLYCRHMITNDAIDCGSGFRVLPTGMITVGGTTGGINFTSTSNSASTADVALRRDAAGILAQRNTTNAQTFRVYDTYTDASNYGRLALNTDLTGDWVQVAAETAGTGGDHYGVAITPSGDGQIVFGTPSAAASTNYARKAVAGIADATATAIFTVSVPNAAHSATIAVEHACSLGAGGAIGANEATGSVSYNISVARTSGVNAVAAISTAYGSSTSSVAGAATITVTSDLSAVSGAVGATNTFTIRATVTKGGGSSANHTCVSSARLLNANASGVTIS